MKSKKTKLDHWNEPNFKPYRVKNLPGEIWKEIDGFQNYEVSNKGRIKRIEREHHAVRYYAMHDRNISTARYYPECLMTQRQSGKTPYLKVSLVSDNGKQITLLAHRLVLAAFVPNVNNLPHVHHKDGNPKNNRLENLEWSSFADNLNDTIRRERLSKALTNKKKPPLSDEQKAKISKSLRDRNINCKPVICGDKIFKSAKEVAAHLGYAHSTVRNWLNGHQPMPQKFKGMGLKFA